MKRWGGSPKLTPGSHLLVRRTNRCGKAARFQRHLPRKFISIPRPTRPFLSFESVTKMGTKFARFLTVSFQSVLIGPNGRECGVDPWKKYKRATTAMLAHSCFETPPRVDQGQRSTYTHKPRYAQTPHSYKLRIHFPPHSFFSAFIQLCIHFPPHSFSSAFIQLRIHFPPHSFYSAFIQLRIHLAPHSFSSAFIQLRIHTSPHSYKSALTQVFLHAQFLSFSEARCIPNQYSDGIMVKSM